MPRKAAANPEDSKPLDTWDLTFFCKKLSYTNDEPVFQLGEMIPKKTWIYEESLNELKKFIPRFFRKCGFQLEITKENKILHWQIRGRCLKKWTKNSLIKELSSTILCNCNISPTTNENKDNFNYAAKIDCTKISTVPSYIFEKNTFKTIDENNEKTIDKSDNFIGWKFSLERIKLHNHQLSIIDIAKKETTIKSSTWNDRNCNFIADFKGNSQKSTLCGVLKFNNLGLNIIKLPCINDYKVLMQDLYQQASITEKRDNFIIIMDFPRALNKDRIYQIYSALEESKEGLFYDPRYDRKEYAINCPSIWIFSNQPPDLECMSNDRWKFWEIENNELLPLTIEDMEYKQMEYEFLQSKKQSESDIRKRNNIEKLIKEHNITDINEIKSLYKKYKLNYISQNNNNDLNPLDEIIDFNHSTM